MSRKPRIEFEGALYHVINRGNYRQELFRVNDWKTARAFEKTLFECCEMKNWLLHAYCIMSNHFHLCIETPGGNLCAGMQWLQSVFANRFNHFVKTPGHVFQGRYKALLVDSNANLLPLVNYIHLNPVRAGVVEFANLKDYIFSSLPKYLSQTKSKYLVHQKWLTHAGLIDRKDPMRDYLKLLENKLKVECASSQELDHEFSNGWCLGDEAFKKEALARLDNQIQNNKSPLRAVGEDSWSFELERCLKKLGKTGRDIMRDKKCADWKLLIALRLKYHLGAGNRFLSENLNMGDVSNLSKQVSQLRKTEYWKNAIWKQIAPNYQA